MATPLNKVRFALCIADEGAEDLQKGKVYRVLPDAKASRSGFVRVIDESDEDYLYPKSYFAPLDLPSTVKRALL
jgi:hypothetical protein